jgi:hypothetical protein
VRFAARAACSVRVLGVDLRFVFVILFPSRSNAAARISPTEDEIMATKTNYILKVQDAKLADIQKALKDANITVISMLEVHKEETAA